MVMTLSDTDIIIDLAHRLAVAVEAVRALARTGELGTTSVTLFEVLSGARSPEELRRYEDLIYPMRIYDLTSQAARQAAAVARTLQAAGLVIGERDTLIAGIALANDCRILTRNVRHFERVPGLQVVTV